MVGIPANSSHICAVNHGRVRLDGLAGWLAGWPMR